MSTNSQSTPGQEAGVPTCYRHPDRETYVRCVRCDRSICPDCMREAAVGHQCVECVREGGRSIRQARTVFGGRVATSTTPAVTWTIIAINVAIYLVEFVSTDVVDRFAMLGQAFVSVGGQPELAGVAQGEWWRLITSAFLHSPPGGGSFGITHILFNMWALWVLGPSLEQVLGRARFLALYLLSALGGSVLLYLVSPGKGAVGASGAIYGLFAAFFIIGRRLGRQTGGIVALIMINLVITFVIPGISWEGHLGGLITGGVVATAYAYAPARQRAVIHIAATTSVAVLFLLLVVVQTAAIYVSPP